MLKMLLTTNNLDISKDSEYGSSSLSFKFKGKFTKTASEEGTKAWKAEFDAHPAVHDWVLVWDCLDMTGFEISARKEWYTYLKECNPRIDLVIIVAKNVLIRGAAKVMMEFFGLKTQIVKSFDDIKISV